MGLRILIVSDHYPPFIGGAHRQTQLLSRKLWQRGHEVRVATVWQPGLPAQENDAGVSVHRLKQLRSLFPARASNKQRHQPPFPDPVTVLALRRLIDEFRPDLVHSYGWISYSAAAALSGKNIPLLVSARDYAYSCATRTLVRNDEQLCSGPAPVKCLACAAHHYGEPKGWLAVAGVYTGGILLKRKLSGMHSISSYVKQIVSRDFLDGNDQVPPAQREIVQEVIPSFREQEFTDLKSDSPELQPYLEGLPKEPFILFVGALRRVKGLEQLVAAYRRLDSPPPLVLIGTQEPDTPRSFPPGVVVLHNFPHPAVMASWERCLFGVVPSLWPEPLGSVVYEGMSKSKAMIGSTPGGHTDMIVDGETGLLVPLGNVEELAQAMRKLLDDPTLRDRLGRAACERARLFTADVAVPRFEQLYQRLADHPNGLEENRMHREKHESGLTADV